MVVEVLSSMLAWRSICRRYWRSPSICTTFAKSLPSSEKTSFPLGCVNVSSLLPELPHSNSKRFRKRVKAQEEGTDSVPILLKNYGFSDTQISKITAKYPRAFSGNRANGFKLKLDFLLGFGFSGTDIAKILTRDPFLLTRSLDNSLIPSLDFLKRLHQSDERVISALLRSTRILHLDINNVVAPNVETLLNCGVPMSKLPGRVMSHPQYLVTDAQQFKKIVEKVSEMGFKPSSWAFFHACGAMSFLTTWDRKLQAYRSFGWSDDQIMSVFKVYPLIMVASEKKIMRVMDFFINQMSWTPSRVLKCPNLILYSLEKRVLPRLQIFELLKIKGLVADKCKLISLLEMPNKQFMKMFLTKYLDECPEILKIYQDGQESSI